MVDAMVESRRRWAVERRAVAAEQTQAVAGRHVGGEGPGGGIPEIDCGAVRVLYDDDFEAFAQFGGYAMRSIPTATKPSRG